METLNRLEASVEKESEEMAEAYVKDEELSFTSIDFWRRHLLRYVSHRIASNVARSEAWADEYACKKYLRGSAAFTGKNLGDSSLGKSRRARYDPRG